MSINAAVAEFIRGPLAISEQGIRKLADLALHAREATPLKGTRKALMRGSVAVLPLNGPLSRQASLFSEFFGASSYETLRKDFEAALENPDVSAIVFDCDSPGGEVAGCGELSKAIFEARGKKQITAYVSGDLCSAAYWIGSACDRIVADPSSTIGSIGVRTVMVDWSDAEKNAGIVSYDIVSDQSPYKVPDAAKSSDRARVKASMTSIADVFISDVSRNRGVSAATVQSGFGRGDVLIGKHAVDAGMADSVGDLESLLSQLNGAKAMSKPASSQASIRNAKCDGCDRNMDDDDETYCRACHAEADASHVREVYASLGVKTPAAAMGALAGLKAKADQVELLTKQLSEIKAEHEEKLCESLIEGAVLDGRLEPAQEKSSPGSKPTRGNAADMRKKYGVDGLKDYLDAIPKSPPPAQVPSSDATVSVPVGLKTLSAEEMEIIKNTGLSPEKFIEHRSAVRSSYADRGLRTFSEEK